MTSDPRTTLKLFNSILLALTLAFVACNYINSTKERNEITMKKYFSDLLKKIDKVEIQYFIAVDTLTHTLTRQQQIDIFKEVINGKEDRDLKCDSTGRFLFFNKDTLFFEAYFSTPNTGSKYDTGVVTYFFKA